VRKEGESALADLAETNNCLLEIGIVRTAMQKYLAGSLMKKQTFVFVGGYKTEFAHDTM